MNKFLVLFTLCLDPHAPKEVGSSTGGYIFFKEASNICVIEFECEHNFVDIYVMTFGCRCCDNVNP